MTLDCLRNFLSAQLLENELMAFDHILYVLWCWQDLGWDYNTAIFHQFIVELRLLIIHQNSVLVKLSWEPKDGFWPNFAYTLWQLWHDLGWDSYGLIFFSSSQNFGLWLMSKFCFCAINVPWDTNQWIFSKLCICINLDKIEVGIVMSQFINNISALDWCQNSVSP